MAPEWQRPASVPLPSVYRRYTGPKAMPDGRKPNFWIQEITSDRDEEIIDFMSDSFLKEEVFCACSRLLEDPLSLEEIRAMWRRIVQQRASLVALTDWPDGSDHPRVAGCNMTGVALRGEHPEEVRGVAIKKVMRGLHHVEDRVDMFERYGVDAFLTALGLSVAPEFRGQDLGRELLMAREGLCKALGLRLTVTVFTGRSSQKQSARAGFELLEEQKYDEYVDEDGKPVFPNASCDTFQLKIKRF